MANSRTTAIRGSKPRGQSSLPAAETPEEVSDPTRPRHVVDHALARREAILEIRRTGGFSFRSEDTDPYLLRAAASYGEDTGRNCPICNVTEIVELTYVYSRELGHASGRVINPEKLTSLAPNYGFLSVHTVEVCQGCGWNHALISYMLGDGQPRRTPRKPRDLVE